MAEPIRLGTRASTLARVQSATIGRLLARHSGRPWQEVLITTPGDDTTKPLDQPGAPGQFVSTLRAALMTGEVDVIVHSYKDLPSAYEPGLLLAAVPGRVDPRDALVSRDGIRLFDLPSGARVGTSSPRRAAALRRLRPDLEVVPIRGNVDTRIRKVRDGEVDATILAVAGLTRMGRTDEITEILDAVLPAPAQGALAIECRSDDGEMRALVGRVDDPLARTLTVAERQVLIGINAECTTAVGAHASWHDGSLHLRAELTTRERWSETNVHTMCGPSDVNAARALGQWAAARLVAGRTRPVLLIRAVGNQADAQALHALGIPSVSEPFVRTTPMQDASAASSLLDGLRAVAADDTSAARSWLVVTSPIAVASWRAAVGSQALTAAVREAAAAGMRAAATGEKSADTLRQLGFHDVLVPNLPSASGLVESLAEMDPGHALFPCGSRALRTLPDGLKGLGWTVDEAVVYETASMTDRPGSADLVTSGRVAAVVLRSPSAAHALIAHSQVPGSVALVCAGDTTAEAVRSAGLPVAAVSSDPSPSAIAEAVATALRGERPERG